MGSEKKTNGKIQINLKPYFTHSDIFFFLGVDSKSSSLNVLVGIGCLCHKNGNILVKSKSMICLPLLTVLTNRSREYVS